MTTPHEHMIWGDCECSAHSVPHDREWMDCVGCTHTGADHEWGVQSAYPMGVSHVRVCSACGERDEFDPTA